MVIGEGAFFLSCCIFRAAPKAYGGSQARGPIGTVADSLHHSHGNTGSEPCLQPMLQLVAILNLLSETRDQTHILTDTMSGSYPAEPQWELQYDFILIVICKDPLSGEGYPLRF